MITKQIDQIEQSILDRVDYLLSIIDLPELTGDSDKQIAYGNDMRMKYIHLRCETGSWSERYFTTMDLGYTPEQKIDDTNNVFHLSESNCIGESNPSQAQYWIDEKSYVNYQKEINKLRKARKTNSVS